MGADVIASLAAGSGRGSEGDVIRRFREREEVFQACRSAESFRLLAVLVSSDLPYPIEHSPPPDLFVNHNREMERGRSKILRRDSNLVGFG